MGEHTHLCSLRGPLRSLNLSLLWQQRGRRGREENGSRIRKCEEIKLGQQVSQPRAWILGQGLGLVPEDQNQEEGNGESPKLAENLRM